uniref:Ig-like domain-containing protein n=1 Tax=Astyanax mexicanus TaxID=7994 RepID=A0A8B9RE52_ASTMX
IPCFIVLIISLHPIITSLWFWFFIVAATHSLQFFYTGVTPGSSFPEFTAVGQVDGEQGGCYDSNSKKVSLKTNWIWKVWNDLDQWKGIAQHVTTHDVNFRDSLIYLMKLFNQTKGFHILQHTFGCELDDDGSKRGFSLYGYDGEDFLVLDLNTFTYIASVSQSVPIKRQWEEAEYVTYQKHFLLYECIGWLKTFVEYDRSTLKRKVSPEVSVFQKDSSSPVVCHATGFFPKAVMITWQKNGEELNEDVDLRETLPNEDGTFQKRSILTLSPEELKNNNYTCVVHHEELEKMMQVSERRVLSGGSLVGTMVGAVMAFFLLLVMGFVGVFIWKKMSGK